jgi:hypothetical protein
VLAWAYMVFEPKKRREAFFDAEQYEQPFSEHFVDFFWHLCIGHDDAALVFLRSLDRMYNLDSAPRRKISRSPKRSRASIRGRVVPGRKVPENANGVVPPQMSEHNGAPDAPPGESSSSTPNFSTLGGDMSKGTASLAVPPNVNQATTTTTVPHAPLVTAHDSRQRREGRVELFAQPQDMSGLSGRKKPRKARDSQSDFIRSTSEMRLVGETCTGPPDEPHGTEAFPCQSRIPSPEAPRRGPRPLTPSTGQHVGGIRSHGLGADSGSTTGNQRMITTSGKKGGTRSAGTAASFPVHLGANSGNAAQCATFVLPSTQPLGFLQSSQHSGPSAWAGYREVRSLTGPGSFMLGQLEAAPYQMSFPGPSFLLSHMNNSHSHKPGADSELKLKAMNAGRNTSFFSIPVQYPGVQQNRGPAGQPIFPGCTRGMPEVNGILSSTGNNRVVASSFYQSNFPLHEASFPIQGAKTSTAGPRKNKVRNHELGVDSEPVLKKKKTTSASSQVRKARSLDAVANFVNFSVQSEEVMQVWRNGERSGVKSAKSPSPKKSALADNWIDDCPNSSDEDPFDIDDAAEIDNDASSFDSVAQVSLEAISFPRPPLCGLPPIWAQVGAVSFVRNGGAERPFSIQSRQEICETFEWFRSYQSGVYHVNGLVKGYLLSSFGSRCVIIVL